jgi:hypothetical protein
MLVLAVLVIGNYRSLGRLAARWYSNTKTVRLQTAYAAQIAPLTWKAPDRPLILFRDTPGDGWERRPAPPSPLKEKTTAVPGSGIRLGVGASDNLSLHHRAFSTDGYGQLEVWVRGDSVLHVALADANGRSLKTLPLERYYTPKQNSPDRPGWRCARVPLTAFGIARRGGIISGVVFHSPEPQADVQINAISLLPEEAISPLPEETVVPVEVTVDAPGHPISEYIYGMAFAPPQYLSDLRLGLNRWGGNTATRYNWEHGNACNAARDWRWANRPAVAFPTLPTGPSSAADAFIQTNRSHGTETLLTIPTIGWVAKNADTTTTSIGVPGTGGEPVDRAEGSGAIAGYDPRPNRQRTSVPSFARKGTPFADSPSLQDSAVYQDEWVYHLTRRFGKAQSDGVRFYAMDNEPDLWDVTHTDVHPARLGYEGTFRQFREYAAAVKALDPSAQITGPVSWGWPGYEYSALDRGHDNFRTHADRKAHDDEPFLLWFLKQAHAADRKAGGKRTLDILDVHYYSQTPGLFPQGLTDSAMRARRIRATRALWDTAYLDESWIARPIGLIPRLREWIAAGYPGTKIGISEWNFGADRDISGGIAIAETLGIFGREEVYLANYWAFPRKNSPGYLAFKLYRNADGQGHGFGDRSCPARSDAPDQVSVFAAQDTRTQHLTLMLINKMPETTARVPVAFRRKTPPSTGAYVPASATNREEAMTEMELWRLSAAQPQQIVSIKEKITLVRESSSNPAEGRWIGTLRLPPYSVTLVRVPATVLERLK